jgi:peptide/nickel transport system ATP-binding protein
MNARMNALDLGAGPAVAPPPLLSVRDLGVSFRTRAGMVDVTSGVSFDVAPGERVGIVGESGCGKTVTGLALLGLLPPRTSRVRGEILLEGRNINGLPQRALREVRGAHIAMIFQEPMSALDPVFTIGEQIGEAVRAHFKVGPREARETAIEALARVGIPLPERRCDEYPHQLSGGMRQRAMIAIALVCKPRLLVADEPTTALDVTVQAQIIDVLVQLSEESGTALLFITHDLGVVAESCHRVLTMYGGQVVEDAPVDDVLLRPRHPYSSGLMRSLPSLNQRKAPLPSIPGRVPQPAEMPRGCRFEPRCAHAQSRCREEQLLVRADLQHSVRCCRFAELRLPGTVAS